MQYLSLLVFFRCFKCYKTINYNNYKCFVGYLYNDYKVKPLHIMLLVLRAYVKGYDGQTE